MKVRNRKDLRDAYAMLKFIEADVTPNGKLEEFMKDLKREIRVYHHKKDENTSVIVKDYGIDGYILLMELPGDFETEKEAESWFLENEWINSYYSAYDCTGQAFSSWVKVCKRRGKWYAYHRISFDF